MAGANHVDHFQQCTHKAQCALNGLALTVHDPGRHTVEHLKQQIAPVHNQQFIHKLFLFFVNFPVCKESELCYNTLLGRYHVK